MNAAGFEFPDDLHYQVEHQMWARPEAEGLVRVGITALGAHLAGDLYMCRPKGVGVEVEAGKGLAVVELAKSIVSVKSPISGTVLEVNPLLASTPETVNADPYGAGWLVLLRATRWEEEAAALVHGPAVPPAMEHHAWLMRAEGDGADAVYRGENSGTDGGLA